MAHCLIHNLSGEPYGYDLTQLNANSPPTWVVGGVKASNQQDDMITFESSNGVDWTRKLNSNKNNRFPGLGCAMALLEYVARSCALHLHNTTLHGPPHRLPLLLRVGALQWHHVGHWGC